MALNFIQVETRAGQPVNVGKANIIPFARSIRFAFPGTQGGFIWNRPAVLLVDFGDGQERVIRLVDVTRQTQVALLGLGLLAGLILFLLSSLSKKR